MQDAVKSLTTGRANAGRWQLWLVILVPTLSMGLAWYMYFYGQFVPDARTNKGELILPPASFSNLGLTLGISSGGKAFTAENLEGRWGVLVFGDASCAEQCQEALYQTRQAHIALGRESERVVRAFVSTEAFNSRELQEEHPGVFWLNGDSEAVLKNLKAEGWPANRYFIVDPLGNIMMGYQAGQAGGDLLKDLKRLLKASNIG